MLQIKNLSCSYDRNTILESIDLEIKAPELIFLLGKNGAGKSTLFKCILGILKNYKGEIWIAGRNIQTMAAKELAGWVSYMPQSNYPAFHFTVLDMVLMGVAHRIGFFSLPKEKQKEEALAALDKVGIKDLADRKYANLSGGERQMVLLARAIAQDAKIWILDEPTSNLDYGNQLKLLKVLQELSKKGYLIILSSHNPEQAFLFSDKVLVLHDKKIQRLGKADEILDEEILSRIYEMELQKLDFSDSRICKLIPKDMNLK